MIVFTLNNLNMCLVESPITQISPHEIIALHRLKICLERTEVVEIVHVPQT